MTPEDETPSTTRLIAVDLDEASISHRGPDVDHERRIAIFDLLETNHFEPNGSSGGPYRLRLALQENRLVFEIALEDGAAMRCMFCR